MTGAHDGSTETMPRAGSPARPTSDAGHKLSPSFAATVGLGSLAGEDQLKASLSSRSDRLFLIIVGKEMEAFIRDVVEGKAPSAALSVAPGTASTSLLAGPSFKLGTVPTSKFQRMLVYKTAEWYGLKAVAGPEAILFVGTMGGLPEKRYVCMDQHCAFGRDGTG